MHMDENELIAFLEKNEIPFQRFDHPAVFTVEQVDALEEPIPGAGSKNLFLIDPDTGRYILLMTPAHKRVDIHQFARLAGARKRLRFAPPEKLTEYLGVGLGSVTVLGVINDTGSMVELYVDEAIWQEPLIQCHPLVNTATLTLTPHDLQRFFDLASHPPRVAAVPGKD